MSSAPQGVPISVTDQPHLIDVTMHIHAPCSSVQLERINAAWRDVGRKDLSRRKQQFKWRTRDQHLAWRYEFDMMLEQDDEDNLVIMTLTASRTRSAPRTILSEQRLKDVRTVLAALVAESLSITSFCSLAWHYPADGVELPIRLPFDLPVASTSEFQAVHGIRVSNEAGTPWIIFDLSPDPATLHVSSGFTYELILEDHMLDDTVKYGASLVAQVGFKSKGEL